MLDKTTKTKIDNARDILVGKVPNPQSQVELITIAMIYKFMDDMDMQNIEMGGNRIFFTDNLEQYAWRKVLSPKLNNWERISLYSEALDQLQVAKQIPELFRKIFKGAFLPFRDGATLSLFLNEIDGFSYNNSENLGNAFEYLLSIMGSQGDAGQFRTPRHIIDFIVDVVNPNRTDTILDPACGTAGFLISAYKHIMEQAEKSKKPLTPAQHQKLMENIVGYDISPDMVKLASVNLFLHQFPQPKIYEYDTLSSEDRWNEKFDIILANPPFMTPKGGIQPHNKFGVKANRAEVLFVDYMMEHLNLKGKAGFVVPEGIIFQSATAYKALRKMMVEENYLYAVVSLPSGVFNPYSGVKTSILLFDRELAKQSENILFVKIDNDGYDLGAQRREIKENDLPRATELLKAYQESLKSGNAFDTTKYTKCLLVSKDEIKENGEYNLSASKYQKAQDFSNCQYEMVKLGNVCEILNGYAFDSKLFNSSEGMPLIRIRDIRPATTNTFYAGEYKKDYIIHDKDLLIGMDGEFNVCLWNGGDALLNQRVCKLQNFKNVSKDYIFYLLPKKLKEIEDNTYAVTVKHISSKQILNIEIPLPPLEIQEEIVKELDQYQAIIDGAQKVVDNWKPTFEINPEWEKVKLGTYITINNGDVATEFDDNGKYACIKVSDMNLEENKTYITTSSHWTNLKKENRIVKSNSIIFPKRGAAIATNKKRYNRIPCFIDNNCMAISLINENKILSMYLFIFMQNFDLTTISNSAGIALINNKDISDVKVPLPSLEEQKAIVAKIEEEEKYVDACKKLIEINKQKISDKIKSIWNSKK